jgi:FMN phosphatase YigB (HAD superfamily)
MHFSLDFWNTLVSPNKEFSYQRNKLIAEATGFDIDDVAIIHTDSKKSLDSIAQTLGLSFTSDTVLKFLAMDMCNQLDDDKANSAEKIELCNIVCGLRDEIDQLFHKYPPYLSKQTFDMLLLLKQKGNSFNITSNTNLISGEILLLFLASKSLKFIFSFYLFSDQVGCAKPNPLIFELIYTNCIKYELSPEVYHIGDDSICDNANGACTSIIINNTSELSDVLEGFL